MPEKKYDEVQAKSLQDWLLDTYEQFKNPIFIKKQQLKEKRDKRRVSVEKKYGL